MIWAHRSVDLVVCIMGNLGKLLQASIECGRTHFDIFLKASGVTMTVLDPAYPPDENGPFAPLVQSYIDESLQLKAEVPELRLRNDGCLFGGEVDGKDVFQSARQKASSPPDVLVGPDSNPTLSFTSGSAGQPKGVLDRHYSLTRYYGWMAEHFNLSSESRFTMLSGIAHDPIQRDIFTPLFLGAQLPRRTSSTRSWQNG